MVVAVVVMGGGKKVVVMLLILPVAVMAAVGAMAVPTAEVGEVTVLMGSDGGDGSSKSYRLLPVMLFAEAILYLYRSSSSGSCWLFLPYTVELTTGFW